MHMEIHADVQLRAREDRVARLVPFLGVQLKKRSRSWTNKASPGVVALRSQNLRLIQAFYAVATSLLQTRKQRECGKHLETACQKSIVGRGIYE
ncbi:hypothetical protein OUZ56_007252 [Daphnia magna]|uniref:Uncharacterized protein n=1 Tax=Daphnia magna TaxID=35525 RepID=A0ABQ9YY24_9CRUS|nr:hypothetical protein OUZ56_007252 [Daphnia magna]